MNLRLTAINIGILGGVMLLAASCGGGATQSPAPQDSNSDNAIVQVPAEPDAVLERFALYVDQGSYLGAAELNGLRLLATETEDETTLQLVVDDAISMRALYFSLEYDETAYSPQTVDASASLPAQSLELPLLGNPGELHYGRVLVDPLAQDGFSGSGVLAELHFANHAFDPADNRQPQAKASSVAPPAQRFELISTDEPGQNYTVMIPYQMPGDYDQNSQVILSDLTPLAVHFGKKAPFEIGSVETVVDGDNNGEINIADISVIGANFQNSFTAVSAVYGDQTAFDSGNGVEIQQFTFGDAQGVSSADRLWFSTSFDIDSLSGAPLVWTLFNGTSGGSAVSNKAADPIAFESEGQRVMSLNAQVFPLQVETGEEFGIFANCIDAELAIGQVVMSANGESVVEDVTFEGEASVLRGAWTIDEPGVYPVTVSFRAGPAAVPRAASLVRSVFSRSFSVEVHAPFSDPPVTGLTLDPAVGAPLGTQLSLSAGLISTGAGSSIDNYEWDFDGDGIFDEEGAASATTFDPLAADVGLGHVTVRVTADNGEQASSTLAYVYNTAGAGTPVAELQYEGPLQFSETSAQLTGLGGVVNGLGDKLGALAAGTGNFSSQFRLTDPLGAVSTVPYEPGTPLTVDLDGAGNHRIDFEVLFAGALFASDSITVTLGARNIELVVFPDNTTIKAPVTFTATPEEPGLIDHYVFDFGDGNQLNTTNATVDHEYTVKQDYDATVTAFWTDDKQNTSAPVHVVCGFERLVELQVDTSPGLVNQELNFTVNVDFPELVTEYTYEFGDGGSTTTTDTTVPHTYLTVGNFKPFLIAVYSDGPTTQSDKLALEVQDPGQLVTEPLLEILSTQNDFPLLVEFTAQNTKFKVGTSLLSFSIDFGDGDSVQNVTDINQSVYHAYYEAGEYTATLTVRDTDFEQTTDDIPVSVVDPGGKFDYAVLGSTPNTFEVERIVPVRGDISRFAWSARAAGGSDGFAIKNSANDLYHLYFASPVDNTATSWNVPVKIAEAKGAQRNLSAASMAGGPAVAYYLYKSVVDDFPDDGDLLYCQATAADGSAWNTPVVVSETGDIGRYPDLWNVNGNPAIVSRLSTAADAGSGKYIRATAADGSVWGSFQDVGPAGTNGAFFQMMNVNDGGVKPAVAMQVGTGGQFRLGFQVADDADGAGWTPADTVVFSSNDRGYGIDMRHFGATPWIAFQDSIAGRIYFTKADDVAGSSWAVESFAIDTADGSFPASFSLGAAGTTPSILVSVKGGTDGAPEPVYVVSAADGSGSSWNAPELVGWTIEHHSVAFGRADDGSQLIMFYDHLNAVGGTGRIRSGARLLP